MAASNKPSLERFGGLAVAREEKKLDYDSSGGSGGMGAKSIICTRRGFKTKDFSDEFFGGTRRGFKTKDFSEQWPLTDGEEQQVAADDRMFVESIVADIVRRQAVPELPTHVDLQVLLDLVGSSIKLYPESHFYWRKRQMVAEKLGISAAMNELQFTEKILSVDARNKFAWFHRQWVLQTFGGGENELAFCRGLLEDDISNEPAWDQRLFAVMRCGVSIEEVKHAVNAISHNPEIEYPWMYLKRLYKEIKDDPRALQIKADITEFEAELDRVLEHLFYSSIDIDSVIPITQVELLTSPSDLKYIQMNIIEKRSEIVNALDALLDLMTLGYEPTEEIQVQVRKLRFTNEYIDFPKSIAPVLEFLYPLKAQYWRRRADQVDKMRYDRMCALLNEEGK